MDKFDRFQLLHRILVAHRQPVPIAVLARDLECTERTVRRLIDQMRDYLCAPIKYISEGKGWQYAPSAGLDFELPGIWLTSEELQSLTALLHVLDSFGNSLLSDELSVVQRHIDKLLMARGINREMLSTRIRVLPLGNRSAPLSVIGPITEALLRRTRIQIAYTDFYGKKSRRNVSPQTLVHYRENWYLDAWCHTRNGLRTFSLARIDELQMLDEAALDVSVALLHEHFGASYGIFAGPAKHTACLRFLRAIAAEVASQHWHPDQQGHWDGNEYVLCFPFGDPSELVGDILRHVPNVVVEGPASLRKLVIDSLSVGLQRYK